jgi:hypothetical protein
MIYVLVVLVSLLLTTPVAAEGNKKFFCSPDPKEPSYGIFGFNGGIAFEDGAPFQRTLRSCLDQYGKISRIELNSNGGSVRAAFIMAEEIAKYSFRTHVPAGARCISACTLVFLGGRRRTKDLEGTYEVHAYSSYSYSGSQGFSFNGIPDNLSVLLAVELLHTLATHLKSGRAASLIAQIPVPEIRHDGRGVSWSWREGGEGRETYSQILNTPEVSKLVSNLADRLSTDITKIERDTEKAVLDYYRFVQKQRVSTKFLDHMFDPSIKSLQVMTNEELANLAVITEPARSYKSDHGMDSIFSNATQ